jgi:hypothetical protein
MYSYRDIQCFETTVGSRLYIFLYMVYTDGVTAYSLTNLWWETTTQDRITSDMIAKTPCPVTID